MRNGFALFNSGLMVAYDAIDSVVPVFLLSEVPELIIPNSSQEPFLLRTRRTVSISFNMIRKADPDNQIPIADCEVGLPDTVENLAESLLWQSLSTKRRKRMELRLMRILRHLNRVEREGSGKLLAVGGSLGGTSISTDAPSEEKKEGTVNEVRVRKFQARVRWAQEKIASVGDREEFTSLNALLAHLEELEVKTDGLQSSLLDYVRENIMPKAA